MPVHAWSSNESQGFSMQPNQMFAVCLLMLSPLFSQHTFAQSGSAHIAVFSASLLLVGALAVYVFIQIRQSLRSHLDKRSR